MDALDALFQAQIRRINDRLRSQMQRVAEARKQARQQVLDELHVEKAIGVTLGYGGRYCPGLE